MTLSSMLSKPYVEQRDNGYWVGTTRVSLDSVVYAFLEGESPESIVQNFSSLSLEDVYGAIAFYLSNRDLIDAYLAEGEAEFQKIQHRCRERNPLLYQKLKAAQTEKTSAVCSNSKFQLTDDYSDSAESRQRDSRLSSKV